jgi:hypothetical protein
MALNGGDKGPLESKFDLCFRRANKFRTMKPGVTFNSHSGKQIASKPRLEVEGCPPAATATLRRAGGRRATLKLTVERHPDAENIKGLSIVLPRGAALVSKRLKGKGVKVRGSGVSRKGVRAAGKRTLKISRVSSKGVRKVTVTLRRGAVRLTGKVRKLARKGKRPRVRIKVRSQDTSGVTHVSKTSARAKR